jgi:hypothetical protein
LDWCKLFADRKHHWRRVVDDPQRFEADLYQTVGVTPAEFAAAVEKITRYRDKFVAHLDNDRTMILPALEEARKAVVFLHERLGQQVANRDEWRGLPHSPKELEGVFTRATQQAESVYDDALRATGRR